MANLEGYRNQLDGIDREMKELFIKRMKTVEFIAREKWDNNIPIFQPEREKEVIAKNSADVDEYLRPLYEKFLRSMMDISKEHQLDTIRDL